MGYKGIYKGAKKYNRKLRRSVVRTGQPRADGNGGFAAYGIAALMFIGVIAGAITANFMDSGSYDSIKNYLISFLSKFDKNSIDLTATFFDALFKYSRVVLVIWLSGFFAAGLVVISSVILVKSFAYGFTTAALVRNFGLYGLVVGFNSYIPQNMFILPAIFFVSYKAMLMIAQKLTDTGVQARGRSFAEYGYVFFIGLICCIIAALIETYITPGLLEFIKPL